MSSYPVKSPKKLIEVALPLDDINEQAAREKSIRHGHPSTLHLWWARRPLAAARAVIFGQLVNDPASLWELQNPGQKPSLQQRGGFTQRRNYLFGLISELVKWENTTNEELLKKARAEIRQSWREVCALNQDHPDAATLFDPERMPGLHDPFAGGGAIPLEAQRLGLEALASDLNPVAVLINKAMIEIPPKFAGRPPIHPAAQQDAKLQTWKGAQGLAEDVRRYGAWMRSEAARRLGRFYPDAKISAEVLRERPDLRGYAGRDLPVIAWLWARTVRSPNPAFSHVHVPLVKSFVLGEKPGKEAWVRPVIAGANYTFTVETGQIPKDAKQGTKNPGRGSDFRCLLSGAPISADYIREQAQKGELGCRMMAIVAEGNRERVYLAPTAEAEKLAQSAAPEWAPDIEMYADALGFAVPAYGLTRWSDLFTARQLLALDTMAQLVSEVRSLVESADALRSHAVPPGYADAIATYLAFVVDKQIEAMTTLCTWSSHPKNELVVSTFRRQALSMTWDFAESNCFGNSSGSIDKNIDSVARVIETAFGQGVPQGRVIQIPAQSSQDSVRFISTDPPYYDNIGYADLADFFYVWLRRSLRSSYPALTQTMVTPKAEELVATPARHGGKSNAAAFFLREMQQTLSAIGLHSHPSSPVTIYYAFKQSETDSLDDTSSTGWETFLAALVDAGFQLTGTWPMRTERPNRSRGIDSNALASSVVLVARVRDATAASTSRREFLRELNSEPERKSPSGWRKLNP